MKLASVIKDGVVSVDISKDLGHVYRYILSWFKENHKVLPKSMDYLIGYVFMSAWRDGKIYLDGWRRDSDYRGRLRDFVWRFFYVHGWEYSTIDDFPPDDTSDDDSVDDGIEDALPNVNFGLDGSQEPDPVNPYIGKFNGRYRNYMENRKSIDVCYKGNLKYLVSGDDLEPIRIEKSLIGRWLKQHGYEKEEKK